jgi:two-component system, cell cycle response regulator
VSSLEKKDNMNIEIKKLELSDISFRIEELRSILNEICCTKEGYDYNNRLEVSQCLDDLIVEYMRKLHEQ